MDFSFLNLRWYFNNIFFGCMGCIDTQSHLEDIGMLNPMCHVRKMSHSLHARERNLATTLWWVQCCMFSVCHAKCLSLSRIPQALVSIKRSTIHMSKYIMIANLPIYSHNCLCSITSVSSNSQTLPPFYWSSDELQSHIRAKLHILITSHMNTVY